MASETSDHLLWSCSKVCFCWIIIIQSLRLELHFLGNLISGEWLISKINSWIGDNFAKSVIVMAAWNIWKMRYNLIFQHKTPNFNSIASIAWTHTTEYFTAANYFLREYSNLSSSYYIIDIYIDASWDNSLNISGLSFIITTNKKHVLLVGIVRIQIDSLISAEIAIINFSLEHCTSRNWKPDIIFFYCSSAIQMFRYSTNCVETLDPMKRLLESFLDIILKTIDQDANQLADDLTRFGGRNPHLSLFSKGLDHPGWIDDCCKLFNLSL